MKMKITFPRFAVFTALALLASCQQSGDQVLDDLQEQNALLVRENYEPIPNQYVVTFKEGTLSKPSPAKGQQEYARTTASSKEEIVNKFNNISNKSGMLPNRGSSIPPINFIACNISVHFLPT